MRYAVLADIHANLPALRAALEACRRRGVDGYVVAGDLVGYGPEPNACVDVVASLDAVCVAGNHDLMALGRLSDERCIPLARESLAWTRRVLREDVRAFLAGLPGRAEAPGGVTVAHGSLDDPQRYVRRRHDAAEQLGQLAPGGGLRVLVLGHTHIPLAYTPSGPRPARGVVRLAADAVALLNPGAVGQSRELRARARALILDLDRRSAEFLRVPYDVAACERALTAAGLSPRSCHLRPSVPRAILREARRRLDRG